MGGGLGMEYGALGSGDRDWARLAELMRDTRTEFGDASSSGLAPSVRSAADAFLAAWSGYAGESAEIGDGFSESLRLLLSDVSATEEERESAFRNLDGRLGPAT